MYKEKRCIIFGHNIDKRDHLVDLGLDLMMIIINNISDYALHPFVNVPVIFCL